MVEGHQVARTAAAHRATLVGRKFRATSPNGRFAQGARDIDGRRLLDVQSVGKNLFYFFEAGKGKNEEERQTVAVHFGMSGRARVARVSSEPEITPTTRLRLVEEVSPAAPIAATRDAASTLYDDSNDDDDSGGGVGVGRGHKDPLEDPLTLHVACMTLLHSRDESLWRNKRASLGPDPLREDADREAVFSSMLSGKNRGKSIGYLLMDQGVIAGVGNIYRAEICHLARVHPGTPAGLLTRGELERVWEASARMLRDGFETGSIVTVRDGTSEAPFDPGARRFVYNRELCARCGESVVSFDINSRTAYACPSCQPQRGGAEPSQSPAKLFASRCAPDDDSTAPVHPSKMTVAQLRAVLESHGLDSRGRKAELARRLEEHRSSPEAAATKRERLDDQEDALAVRLSSPSQVPSGLPRGTRGLVPATPAAAAAEKRRAGEKANVEHVAQAGDDLATAYGPVTPAPKSDKGKEKR